jgi:glycosyltransferase involved in cell wall biosynthesis
VTTPAASGGRSLRGIGRRILLTYRYLGLRTLAWRALSFPLRFTPLRLRLGFGTPAEQHLHAAARWHRREAPPVTLIRAGEPLAAPPGHDLAVLGDGVQPDRTCIAALQFAAHEEAGTGVTTGLLLTRDGAIAAAGLARSAGEADAMAGRYAGRPADHGPAHVAGPVLAASPACAVITAAALEAVGAAGGVEEASLRAWDAGCAVRYIPAATARLRRSQPPPAPAALARRLDQRRVRTANGRLRVIYVTQATSVGGGHRDIYEHLNRLQARGHDVALFTLGPQPDWFDLEAPLRSFPDWEALTAALDGEEAIKVATWWRSAMPVWLASRRCGVPVYFVQDIETSYYPDDQRSQDRVLDTYRTEFRYMTISGYNRDGLCELGVEAEIIPPGIDLETFRPLPGPRREEMLLALGRGNHLKNLDLTVDAWKALGEPRPELCLFGIEPELGQRHGARYVTAPSDEEVNALFNQATVFLQTSRHEGFALPPLEAMATGAAVVCTDAHGNRDFCVDGVNCLMPASDVDAVRAAVQRLLGDPDLRRRLGEEGIRTAREYAWERRIDALEAFLEDIGSRSGPPT